MVPEEKPECKDSEKMMFVKKAEEKQSEFPQKKMDVDDYFSSLAEEEKLRLYFLASKWKKSSSSIREEKADHGYES